MSITADWKVDELNIAMRSVRHLVWCHKIMRSNRRTPRYKKKYFFSPLDKMGSVTGFCEKLRFIPPKIYEANKVSQTLRPKIPPRVNRLRFKDSLNTPKWPSCSSMLTTELQPAQNDPRGYHLLSRSVVFFATQRSHNSMEHDSSST